MQQTASMPWVYRHQVAELAYLSDGKVRETRMNRMSGNDEPKSSFELAMERLRKKDEAAGVEPQALTEKQRANIAEVRSLYAAKLAQAEVLHKGTLDRTFDPAERAVLEEQYRRERDRLTSELESKVEKARRR